MGISLTKARSHIEQWCETLRSPSGYIYRTKWPKYLFHHASLSNATSILNAGALLSRYDAAALAHDDVAPAEVIARRSDAHKFARLYFRPRTPTQYQVEGIRKADECYLGDSSNHVPVLYMFLFFAESVLALDGTQFSNGNMQSPQTKFDGTEDFFDSIPFGKVFHEGSFDQSEKDAILKARCAEVLAESPLLLTEHLKFVLCRSEAERHTLLDSHPQADAALKARIRTFTEVGIFQSQYTYIKGVDLLSNSCLIQFAPRRDGKEIECELLVRDLDGHVIRRLPKKLIDSSKRLRVNFNSPLSTGTFKIEIQLEGHLAYRNTHLLDDLPF
jgi:hypothetical protein